MEKNWYQILNNSHSPIPIPFTHYIWGVGMGIFVRLSTSFSKEPPSEVKYGVCCQDDWYRNRKKTSIIYQIINVLL